MKKTVFWGILKRFYIMTIHALNIILQIGCVTLLALAGILLLRHAKTGLNTWTGISLVIAVICYLILETPFIHERKLLFLLAVTGSTCIPVIFFLLTKAVFDDHFKPTFVVVLWFAIEIAVHFWVYLRDIVTIPVGLQQLSYILAEIVSIGFVLAGIYTAIKTRKGDLIESRMKFRKVFVMITAALIGITLIVESMTIARESVDFLQILQRSSILGLTLFFLMSNFEIKSGFFFRDRQKEKPPVIEDGVLRRKLEILIEEKKVYRKDGLTIRELAEMLNEQEYKVRRLINGELGFRNFNDFLNKYRVNEACEILNDPTQNRKTILEIAYGLGYQSIGPFNKAFKELKETTPTAYRKALKS
jgi:AraC-like DNA-binding protein